MNFDSYNKGQALCLAEGKTIDCVYIFYTTSEGREILPELTPSQIDIMCGEHHGVLRSKGVICKNITDKELQFIITSKGGKRLGVNTPEFSAGVKIYNVALAVSGNNVKDDILMVSTPLTPVVTVPAGTHIITEIKLELV